MEINIVLKSISNTRSLEQVKYSIRDDIETLSDLICNLVEIEIYNYKNAEKEKLSETEIENMLKIGKVTFGVKYNKNKVDIEKSKEVALLGFKDGLFRVFLNENEVESLDDNLNLKDNDELSLIRLTMFAGSKAYWI